jgi:hypothetical protein
MVVKGNSEVLKLCKSSFPAQSTFLPYTQDAHRCCHSAPVTRLQRSRCQSSYPLGPTSSSSLSLHLAPQIRFQSVSFLHQIVLLPSHTQIGG